MRSTSKSTMPARRAEDRLDRVFGALSSRVRRALLKRLGQGPAYLTELAEPFEMSLPAVSKHVRVLEDAGLLRREIDGRVHRCSFEPAPLGMIERWLTEQRGFWTETLDALAEFAEASKPMPSKRR